MFHYVSDHVPGNMDFGWQSVMGQLPETCCAHPILTAMQYSSSELSLGVGYHHLSIYPPIYHQHRLNANANCTVFPQSLAISFIFLAHSFINSHFKRRQLFSAHQSVHQGASKCIRSHIFFRTLVPKI